MRKSHLLAYALIALPLSFAGLPLYIYIPDFYVGTFGVNIGILGALLLAIRLFDAVQDPLIGYFSDRYATFRFGIVTSGLILLVAGMAGLVIGPPAAFNAEVWFAVFMLAATTGFSIATININTIGGFWKSEPALRVLISSWRERIGLVGILLAAILPALLQNGFTVKASYMIFFCIFAILIIAAGAFFSRFAKAFSADNAVAPVKSSPPFAMFSIITRVDPVFFGICFLSYLASSIPAVLVLFFIRNYIGAEHLTGFFLGLYFIAGAAFMPVWVRLSRLKGDTWAWAASMLLAVIAFSGAALLGPGDIALYAVICAFSGIALGGDLALPPAIIAGRIESRHAGDMAIQYYAIFAFTSKLALALAAGGSFMVLEYTGFSALIVIYAIIPVIIKLIASGLLGVLIMREYHAV